MSLYQFISSKSILPQLLSDKKRLPDGSFKRITFSDEDIFDLEILECLNDNVSKDVFYYTNYKNIYSIEWQYTEVNCKKLLDYLKSVIDDNSIEIWSIRLCNITDIPDKTILENIKTFHCSIRNLTLDLLKDKIKCKDSSDTPKVLIITP